MTSLFARGLGLSSLVVMMAAAAACVGGDDDPPASNASSSSGAGGASSSGTPPSPSASSSSSSGAPSTDDDAGRDGGAIESDASDSGPTGLTAPLADPDIWLDARLLPGVAASIDGWPDSSGHGANATSGAHPVKRGSGPPEVQFDTTHFTPFVVDAAHVPSLHPAVGFTAFVVARYQNSASRAAQAYLLHRSVGSGFPTAYFTGLEIFLDGSPASTLTTTNARLFQNATRAAPTAALTGAIPSEDANHLYVLHVLNGSAQLRVDGAQIATAGSLGSDYAASDGEPLRIGSNKIASDQFALIGGISLVAYYGRALTPTEIAQAELKTKADFQIP